MPLDICGPFHCPLGAVANMFFSTPFGFFFSFKFCYSVPVAGDVMFAHEPTPGLEPGTFRLRGGCTYLPCYAGLLLFVVPLEAVVLLLSHIQIEQYLAFFL